VELGCEIACHLGFSITGHPSVATLKEVEQNLPEWSRDVLSGKLEEISDTVMIRLNLFECEFMVACL
jgi:hypothetical protein